MSDRDESNLRESADDAKERARLADLYAKMADGELENLARSPESLTDAAWDALEDEFDHRHLRWPEEETVEEKIDLCALVTIRQFRDLPEALLAKGSLESVGISCFLRDENLVRLDWFISNFIGGVKLCVKPEDVQNALQVLNESIPEGLYVHGVGLYEQPRCPKCQSLDVTFREIERPIAFLRVPIPVHREAWRCSACGAEWEDEAQDEESGSAGPAS